MTTFEVPEWDASAADQYAGPRFGPEAHVVVGRTQEVYDQMLAEARRHDGGVKISNDPGYHAHPSLGITGHLHGEGGRRPHTHRQDTTPHWDTKDPVWLDDAGAEGTRDV